jgi:50S ribosomal subunit-associated GTPase HflX
VQGVFWKGGIIVDAEEDHIDPYDEWKNKLVRDSFAKSSLISVRKVSSSIFFTKGKLNEIGQFIKGKNIDVVFVNSMLTPLQQSKLEKRLNDFMLNREERLRRYYIRSANKSNNEPTDIDTSSGYVTGEGDFEPQRQIRVLDRFGIILMIFASRAKSNISKLQIELAWLEYARTNLTRGTGPTFGKFGKLFETDLTINPTEEVEIKSYRGRGTSGKGGIHGQGETQLELERRQLTDRKALINQHIKKEIKARADARLSRQKRTRNIPLIALVGYTNVGKTTLMNKLTNEHLGVEDQLFHTLSTTVRK